MVKGSVDDRGDKLIGNPAAVFGSLAFIEDQQGVISADRIDIADGETIILGGELMENMEEDLDSFFDNLMKD